MMIKTRNPNPKKATLPATSKHAQPPFRFTDWAMI